MYKNTLKKPNSQLHPNSLSPTRQEKNTILSFYAAARLLGIISNNFFFFFAYHKAYIYIYIYYFIKPAVGIPKTTCIRSISMTGLGLVGLMDLWQNSSHTSRHTSTISKFLKTKLSIISKIIPKHIHAKVSKLFNN